MNWFKKAYGKDTMAKVAVVFIMVFLIIFTLAAPYLWIYSAGALVGFMLLFYFMRNK